MLLLSDLLLVTKRQGKILTVTEEPLPLEQVMAQDFHCSDCKIMLYILCVDGHVLTLNFQLMRFKYQQLVE